MSQSENIKSIIKSKGYWRVSIRPSADFYKKDRFSLNELSQIIESTQVRLRGWYYPHISRNDIEVSGQNRIRSFVDFDGLVEYWEFSTSGNFAHIFSMREDYIITDEQAQKIKSNFHFNKERGQDINKFFEVLSAVYRFTEIYKFASNLAQLEKYKDVEGFDISIELYGVRDRMLYVSGFFRELWSPYVCNVDVDKIIFPESYKTQDLIAKFNEFALDKIIKTFNAFGWDNPSPQVFEEDQKKLLGRRL